MPILYLIAEGIAFITSLLLWKSDKFYRSFIAFTFCVFTVEIIGRVLVIHQKGSSNHILYNFFNLFYYNFCLLSVYTLLKTKRYKKIVLLFVVLFSLFWALNLALLQKFDIFNSYSFILSCIFLCFSCLFYFIEIIKADFIIKIIKEPIFFIVSGFLFFSFLTAVIYTLHEYFAYKNSSKDLYRQVFNLTMEVGNVVLYLLLGIAFVIQWKKQKS